MQPIQHMMGSTHVWASTQIEEETVATPAMLPSVFECKASISKAGLVFYFTLHSKYIDLL